MSGGAANVPLAVVGMACRLPGGDGLDDFWRLLVAGRDAVGELPPDRLDRELYYSPGEAVRGKTYSSRGGVVDERPLDDFIRSLPPELVADADLCHLVLCETAARALAHAGYDPRALPSRNMGVYVGHSAGSPQGGETAFGAIVPDVLALVDRSADFAALSEPDRHAVLEGAVDELAALRPLRADGGRRLQAGAAASLTARAFGLDGPQLVIDAACASSLVGLQAAAAALERDSLDAALVCGASYNKSDSLVLFSQARSCSAGDSRPFDAAADGLISSEGYVVLVVKTLDRALADGNVVYAVIRGIGVSSDGRGRSLWAPRREGQVEAIRRAYECGVDPATIQYVEMHATSTQVGDATETAALAEFLADNVADRRVPIGSVKSNIGHTLETAGLAGLLKTILAMRHRLIPPSINVRELSREIDWERLPMSVVREAIPWPDPPPGQPRRAAVNAFGIGGLNVHVVVEEYLPGATRAAPPSALPNGAAASRPAAAVVRASRSEDAVAVIGRGVVLPGAFDREAFRRLTAERRDVRTSAPWDGAGRRARAAARPGRPHLSSTLGGFLHGYRYDWRRHKIPPKQLAAANLLQFLLLDAADQALDEARAGGPAPDPRRTGVVIGTIFGGDFSNQLHVGLRLPELRRALRRSALQKGVPIARIERMLAEFEASVIAEFPAITDETGSFTSSTLASRLTKTFDLMGGALAVDTGDCSGAAAAALAVDLLVTRRNDVMICAGAQRAMGPSSYESLALNGLLLDPTRTDAAGYVPGEGVAVVVLKRLADAVRDGNRIYGILRPPGVGFDPSHPERAAAAARRRAVEAAFGSSPERDVRDDGVSTVHLIGHLQAAQPIVDLVRSTQVWDGPAGDSNSAESEPVALTARTVDGLAYCSILEPPPPSKTAHGAVAAPFSSVLPPPTSLHPSLSAMSPPPPVLSSTCPPRSPAAPVRSHAVGVFAGQGSHYPGMIRDLAEVDPSARTLVDEADALFAERGLPTFRRLAWEAPEGLGTDVRITQLAVLVADLAYFRALAFRGVRFDWLAGHSYGEIAALTAAGAWTFEQAVDLTLLRSAAVVECEAGDCSLLAVGAGPLELQAAAAEAALPVYFTHHNAPRQTVVAGKRSDVARFAEIVKRQGRDCRELEVPRPYHSPLLRGAVATFRRSLQDVVIRPPTIPVLSGVTNRFTVDPDEIRENLAKQLAEPLRYVDLVRRLYDCGARLFVEIGPSDVLTNLHRRILSETDAVLAASDVRGRSPVDLLLEVERASSRRLDDRVQSRGRVSRASTRELANPAASPSTAEDAPPSAVSRSPVERPPAPTDELARFDATQERRRRARATARSRSTDESLATRETRSSSPATGASAATATAAPKSGGPERLPVDLEAFLISFVVEQTGYPPEVVELDADLEADLGIDSIKKAQLFGELRELCDLPPREQMRLGDFRTLRDVERFLRGAASAASAPPDESCDESSGSSPLASPERLEAFLIRFVVEQTGYPPEVVDLDADLEADLGLDSIKKAQILGELREQFAPSDGAPLKPADYPTLRHIRDHFLHLIAVAPAPAEPSYDAADDALDGSVDNSARPESESAVDPIPSFRRSASPVPSLAPISATVAELAPSMGRSESPSPLAGPAGIRSFGMPVLDLAGSSYDVGLRHGAACREEIRTLLRRHADLNAPSILPSYQAAHPKRLRSFFSPDDLEELEGIAAGAEVSVAGLLAHNLALTFDDAAGCVHFAVTAWRNGTLVHAANEDCPRTFTMRDALRGLVQVRRAADGGESAMVTVVGQVAGINGLNSSGLAVTSTKLIDRPLRHSDGENGRAETHPALVKRILRDARNLDDALAIVRDHPRFGSWSLCISHAPADRLVYVEYDGRALRVREGLDRIAAANHSLLETRADVVEHSRHRLARLDHLLDSALEQAVDVASAQRILLDRYDVGRNETPVHPTMNTVCRADNLVGVVMTPAARELRVHGQAPAGPSSRSATAAPAGTAAPAVAMPSEAESHSSSVAPSTSSPITRRFVLRMVERPLPNSPRPQGELTGAVLMLGRNAYSSALRRLLERRGKRVVLLPDVDDVEATAAAVDAAWDAGPAPCLLLTAPCDSDAATTLDSRRHAARRRAIDSAYWTCRRWARRVDEAGLWDRAAVGAVTSLGGDFGVGGSVRAAEGGAFAGLLKSLCIENWVRQHRQTAVKIVDVGPGIGPEVAAAVLWRELSAVSVHVEIGCLDDTRRVLRALPEPLPSTERRSAVRRGANWVCTGGARGITAFTARRLANTYGLRLHLLGTAPYPSIDLRRLDLSATGLTKLRMRIMRDAQAAGRPGLAAWQEVEKALEIARTLRAFAADGIEASYYSCDVADRAALAQTLNEIRRTAGPIEGVLHGAGYGKDCRFDRKEPANVARCFGAKVDGAANLMELTRDDPLQHFIAFGSISGRFGANGHTDYSAANDMLAKQVAWFRRARPDCRSTAFHWHAWDDVGMAVKPETRLALQLVDMEFMPAREGVECVVKELEAGLPEAEVLITTEAYHARFQPEDVPSVDVVGEKSARLEFRFDPQREPFLLDHRLDDRPLLPIVVGLELLAQAARNAGGTPPIRLTDVEAIRPLKFADDRPRTVAAIVRRAGANVYDCVLESDVRRRDGRLVEAARPFVRGRVECGMPVPPADFNRAAIVAPLGADARAVTYLERPAEFFLGPRLRCLRRVWFSPEQVLGEVVAPDPAELAGSERASSWLLPSAAIDACLYALGLWIWHVLKPGTALPERFRSVRFGRLPRPGELCMVIGRRTAAASDAAPDDAPTDHASSDDPAEFDFELRGADDDRLVLVEGYRVAWLQSE